MRRRTGRSDRRAWPRIACGVAVHLQVRREVDDRRQLVRLPAWLSDTTVEGASLVLREPLPPGTIYLEYPVANGERLIALEIRNWGELGEFLSLPGPFYRYGARFIRRISAHDCLVTIAALR